LPREGLGGMKAAAARQLVARGVAQGPSALTPAQRLRLLADVANLGALAEAIRNGTAHQDWVQPDAIPAEGTDGQSVSTDVKPAGTAPDLSLSVAR
jgi:hypothetical protein